jgi:Tfp pilus assembly protein PilP
LNAQADRLRERTATVALRASTRNPFQFNSIRTRPANNGTLRAPDAEPLAIASPAPIAPPAPVVTLAGIAKTAGKRTAIITIAGQLYLVREGDALAGRYAVVTIDAETVLIRDSDGAEQRLVLR